MSNLLPKVALVNNTPITTSFHVAEYFGKQHKDVLRKIESLGCSTEFTKRNFTLSEYKDTTGRKLPSYEITQNGFAILGMGFSGKKAMVFKEAYLNAFNAMAAKLGISDQGLTPMLNEAQCADIRALVTKVVNTMHDTPKTAAYCTTYSKLHIAMRVKSYRDILQADFNKAIDFLYSLRGPKAITDKADADTLPALPAIAKITLPISPMGSEYVADFYCSDLSLEPLARLIHELSQAEERGEFVEVSGMRGAQKEYTAIISLLRRYHNQFHHIKSMMKDVPSVHL